MKKLIAKIVTSITYAHYMESMHKGIFQKNIDEMFRLNGIPRVVFPTNMVTDGIREILKDTQATQQQDTQPDETKEESRGATAMDADSHKRTRELSISPQIMNESKKKREKNKRNRQQKDKKIRINTNLKALKGNPLNLHPGSRGKTTRHKNKEKERERKQQNQQKEEMYQ